MAQDYARVLTKNAAFDGKPVYEIDTSTMGRRQTEVRGKTIIGRDARGPLPGSWQPKQLADEYNGPIAALKDLIDKGLVPKKSTKWIDPDSGNINVSSVAPNVYKVDLPDEVVPRMLDWDKPLSQQHSDVQAALAKIDKDTYHPQGGDYSPEEQGQMIYMRLANSPLAKNQVEAAELLKRSGIPGIKYLDAASRGASTGTRNFVVFPGNEGLLNILGRE